MTTKIVTVNGRVWEIHEGAVMGPPNVGGRPPRPEEREAALIEAAAKAEITPNAAAKSIHSEYFAGVKATSEQKQNQIKYLAKLIRQRRTGLVSLD